jgi:DNA polymerase epsilon subunit 2
MRQKVKHVTFASNPCRLRYYTQEIVLFREDLLKKMQRHLVVPLALPEDIVPEEEEEDEELQEG